jgi:uncharacterized membrane protein
MNLKILAFCLSLGIAGVHAENRAEVASEGLASNIFTTAITYEAESWAVPLERNYETVAFKNKCYKSIAIFVHYLNLNNNWITDGYYKLAPNQNGNIFNSRNTIFYYYAQSTDGTLIWRGNYEFRFRDVVIPMEIVEMNIDSWGTYTMTLTCN